MKLFLMLVLLRMRIMAVVLLVAAALVCAPDVARAELLPAHERDCAGPACEQQIACARPDQVTAPSRQSAEPLAVAVTPAVKVSLPQEHAMAVVVPAAVVGSQPVTSLAPRSPPSA